MKIASTSLLLCLSTLFWTANGQRAINFPPGGCHRNCPFNYDPICGSDGKTYANFCSLIVARRCDNIRVRKQYDGECGSANTNCRPNIGCPFNYAPVCGSDGQTYPNECVFRNAACQNPNLRKVSDGECGSTNQNCRPTVGCPFNYAPVCGSDGQTYGNLCAFQNAACNIPNLTKVSDGECGSTNQNCRPSVGCPFNYAPVCGSDGQTYGNLCTFQNAACNIPNLTKISDGECGSNNANCRQSAGCPFNYAPVCGSNGQTYANDCAFRNAACSDPNLTKVSDGECGNGNPNCRPSSFCPLNYSPICGSDGKTYGNECDFGNAACKNPKLERLFSGECGVRNPLCKQTLFCPRNYEPVCGSNGQTYDNECLFSNAACTIPDLRKAYDGQCNSPRPNCPDICPANYDPVCGSDGKTYGNACNLGVASCNNPSIRKVSDGECGFNGRVMSFIENNF